MATYLGIDIGTSGTKAILLSENGTVLATNTQEYSLSTPKPQWAEQSPDQQWSVSYTNPKLPTNTEV